jgi:DNA-directed RNA polymerase alpha subunit
VISDEELFAGLEFLLRHSPPEYRGALEIVLGACTVVRDSNATDKLRARRVDDLELSVRSANALQGMGLKTIGEVEALMAKDDELILFRGRFHHFTKKSLKEVRLLLKSIGLEVRRATADKGVV